MFALARPADVPDSSLYTIIRGAFVIEDYEPDGDSVRFIADNIKDWDSLENAKYIHQEFLDTKSNQNQDDINKKNSVQLRFEGIDTPEFGNSGKRQPLGKEARDFTLSYLGFTNIEYTKLGKQVRNAEPRRTRGVLLSKAAIGFNNGRPIAYVFREQDWNSAAQTTIIQPDWLEKSLNYQLLQKSLAFPEFYNTMPPSHRAKFQRIIEKARVENRGIWQIDQSAKFLIPNREAIRETGTLIHPKLYRRLETYFEAFEKKETTQSFIEFLQTDKGIENDQIRVGTREIKFSDVLKQKEIQLGLQVDSVNIIFY